MQEGGQDDWSGVGGDVAEDCGIHGWDETSRMRQAGSPVLLSLSNHCEIALVKRV